MIVTERAKPEQAQGIDRPFGALSRLVVGSRALLAANGRLVRVLRYAITSGLSTVVSEVILVSLLGTQTLGATSAALLANVAGGTFSYLLSRYWIWSEAERTRTARQLTLYWATSAVSWLLSTVVTRVVAHNLPLEGTERLVVIGAAFFATYTVLWLAKFSIYQRFVFTRTASEVGQPDRLS